MSLEENYIKFIEDIDPSFKEHTFKLWCHQVLLDIQQAWTKKDKSVLARHEVKELYDLHCQQIDVLKARNIENVTKDMKVDSIEIVDFKVTKNEELIKVILDVSLIDYYEDMLARGLIKKGNERDYVTAKYTLVFTRPNGFKSSTLITNEVTTCPHCGGAIDVFNDDICEYCSSTLTTMNAIYKIKSLAI